MTDYSQEQRDRMASSGQALPDGSYPIANCEDLRNAVHAYGRGDPSHRSQIAAHIRKRHAELGGCGVELDKLEHE